jgi:hypothetical protein
MISNTKQKKSMKLTSELLHYCQWILHLSAAPSLLPSIFFYVRTFSQGFSKRPFEPPAPPRAARLDSQIVSSFPRLFDEFRGKRFVLLWRGSRDGFGGRDFHGRCDGRANTLTLILDTGGNVFGGFTPLRWESRGCSKRERVF